MNAPHEPPAGIARRPVPAAMLAALRARFAERCSTAAAVRDQHGRDESIYPVTPPDAVVFCQDTSEVASAVALAAQYAVPVIPFGIGSSLEGHLLAVQGGLSIDLSGMDRIVAVNAEDLTVTVQAGVTREQLNREIKDSGLFFPIDPGANATLGGMAATRASGTNAVRYGTMRENVLGLTVVTAAGEVIRTGTRAKKSSAGYDLTRLYVGSEGTLGVITEICVRLLPRPEAVKTMLFDFDSIEAGKYQVFRPWTSGDSSHSYVQANTKKNFKDMQEKDEEARQARNDMLRALQDDLDAQRVYLRQTSMLTSAHDAIARVQSELTALTA